MRWLAASIVVHALVLWLVWPAHVPPPRDAGRAPTAAARDEVPTSLELTEVEILVDPAAASGGGGHASAYAGGPSALESPEKNDRQARQERQVGTDPVPLGVLGVLGGSPSLRCCATGDHNGNGNGDGSGNGIGFGDGGGIARTAAVPLPPAPPPPSKARPARLLQPSRDREVEDGDHLFVARVTVDPEGDVVAVRMLTTHPGLRGDQASSAIWSFRYAPALDDAGLPIRSTFEQPFQIR